MKTVRCATCEMQFGIEDEFYQKRLKDGEGFACPLGHISVFRPSENDRLKDRVQELEKTVETLRETVVFYSNRVSDLFNEVTELRKEVGIQKRRATHYQKKAERLTTVEVQRAAPTIVYEDSEVFQED